MLDLFLFVVRYTPFWAVPIFFISVEFGRRYFVKKKKSVYSFCFGIAFFCFISMLFYFVVGGPEKSVKMIIQSFILNQDDDE